MAEVVGSLAIELELDRSRFDRELAQLRSINLDPINLTVNVDARALQQQLRSLQLDSIPVQLRPDIDGLKQSIRGLQLDPITLDVTLRSSGVQQQLNDLVRSNKSLAVDIDTSKSEESIRRLSREVDSLRANIRSLNQEQVVAPRVTSAPARMTTGAVKPDIKVELDKNPKIKVRLDNDALQRELEISAKPKFTQKFNTPVPGVNGAYTLSQNPSLKLNVDSVEIRSAIAQAASTIVTGLSRNYAATQQSNGVRDTAGSLYTGFVESIGASFLPLLQSAIVSGFKVAIPDFQSAFKTGAGIFSSVINAATGPFRQIMTGFQQGIGVSISSSFANGFQKKLETEFGFTFEKIGETSARRLISRTSRVLEKTGAVANREDFKDTVRSGISFYEDTADDGSILGGARRRYQEGYKAAAERVKARAAEIAPTLPPIENDRVAFVSGGYAGAGGKSSRTVAEALKPILNQSDVVPVDNTHTDVRYDAAKNPGQWAANAVTNTVRNGLQGSNRDAEEMAAQAYARYLMNPASQIDLVGHSAGGFVASDAQQILKQLGVPSRALSFGTPHFGVLNPKPGENYRADMGALDPLSPLNLASPNAKFYDKSTGAGHLAPTYTNSPAFQESAQQFLYDSPKLFTTQGVTTKLDRDTDQIKSSLQSLGAKQTALEAEIAKANAELDKAQQDYERQRQSQRKRDRNTARVIVDRQAYAENPEALIAKQKQRYGAKPVDESRIGVKIPKAGLLDEGIEPTKQAFQARVKDSKAKFREQFESAKSAVGGERVKRLRALLAALDEEQHRIEQDLARKLGKSISGVLGNYKGVLTGQGGLRSQVQQQLASIEPKVAEIEKPKPSPKPNAEREINQFVQDLQGKNKPSGNQKLFALGAIPALAGLGQQAGGFALPNLAQVASFAASPLGLAGLGAAGIAGGIGAARAARPILEPIAPVLYKDVGEIGRKAGSLLVNGIRDRVQSAKEVFTGLRQKLGDGVQKLSDGVQQFDATRRGFGVGRANAGAINYLSQFDTGKYDERLDTRRINPNLTNLGKTYAAGATVAANAGTSVRKSVEEDANRVIDAPIAQLRQAVRSVVDGVRNPISDAVGRFQRGEKVDPVETVTQAATTARDLTRSGGRRVLESVRQSAQEVRDGKSFNPIAIARRAVSSARENFQPSLNGAMAGSRFQQQFGGILQNFKILKSTFDAGFNIDKPFKELADNIFPGLSGQLGSVVKGFLAFTVLNTLIPMVAGFGKEALAASIRLDNLKTAMNFATGSPATAAKELGFVRKEVDRLGIPLKTAQDGYAKLRAALKGSAGGELSKNIFQGVGSAATVLGLNGDQQGRIFTALQQIASKGILSSEELKGQIGDAGLAGAFGVAARAIGVTEQELNKLLETGAITSNDFLPKFARQLQIEFGGSAEAASKNAQSAIFRLESAFQKLQESTGSTFQPAVMVGANALTGILSVLADRGSDLARIFGIAATVLAGQFVVSLVGIPGLVKLAITGFTALSGVIARAAATLLNPQFLAGFAAISAGIELFRTLNEAFQGDELASQFKTFADQAVDSLKRVEDQSNKTKQSSGLKSQGFDLTLGLGKAIGLGTITTDDALLAVRDLPGIKQAREFASSATGGRFTPGRTVAEMNYDRAAESGFQANTVAQNVRFSTAQGKIFDRQTGENIDLQDQLQKVAGADKEVARLQQERSRLASMPQPDKTALKDLDDQLQKKTQERDALSNPINAFAGNLTNQSNNAKAAIAAIDAQVEKGEMSPEKAATLKLTWEAVVSNVEQSQKSLNKFQSQVKTSTSVTVELKNRFLEVASAIETIGEKADEAFKRTAIDNLKNRIGNFGKNENASLSAGVEDATAQRDRNRTVFEQTKAQVDGLGEDLAKPEFQSAISGIRIGNTGKTASVDSSVAELETAKQGETNGDKKNLLDRLIEFKKNRIKLVDLEKEFQESEFRVIQAKEQEKLGLIERAYAKRDLATKQRLSKEQVALINKQKDKSISEEDAAIESAQLSGKQTDADLGNVQKQLEDLNGAFNKGEISKEQFTQKRMELEGRVADLTIKKAQDELAIRDAINRKIIEGIERRNKLANARIDASASDQIFNIKQTQLNGGMVGEGGAAEIAKVEMAATQQRMALKQQELQDIRRLRDQRVLSEKEAIDRTLAAEQELRDGRSKLIDLQTQEVLRGIQNEADARKRAASEQVRAIELVKAADEALSAGLERRKSLIETELKLNQAVADSRQSALKQGVDRANEAGDLQKQIAGGELGSNGAQVAQRQLAELGFSGQNQLQIVQQRQALEAEADRERLVALQQQQELEKQSLQLQLQLEEIAGRRALNEAKIAENKARQNLIDAEKELRSAQLTGDSNQIANAQDAAKNAAQGIELAKQGIGIAEANNQALSERIAKEQQINDIQQQRQRDDAQSEAQRNQRAREREAAQLKDQRPGSSGGLSGGSGGSGLSGGGGSGDRLLLAGDDINAYDRASKTFFGAIKNAFGGEKGRQEAVLNAIQTSSGREKEFLMMLASKGGYDDVVGAVSKLDNLSQGGRGIEVASAVNRASMSSNGDVVGALKQLGDRLEKNMSRPNVSITGGSDPVGTYADFVNRSSSNMLGNL